MTQKQKTQHQALLTQAHHDYARGMSRYSFFKIHDQSASDDLVQDTFMRTWKYLVSKGKIDIMKAFLYHVLNQLIIDEYRNRKHRTVSLEALLEQGYEPSVDQTERLWRRLDGQAALLLIQRLPLKYQKVMRLRYFQDLSLQEIALVTHQSKNTTAVQLHRGLEKLRKLYRQTDSSN